MNSMYISVCLSLMQRLWGLCTDEQKRGIMHEILPAVNSLAEDKYGNYVVQVNIDLNLV